MIDIPHDDTPGANTSCAAKYSRHTRDSTILILGAIFPPKAIENKAKGNSKWYRVAFPNKGFLPESTKGSSGASGSSR